MQVLRRLGAGMGNRRPTRRVLAIARLGKPGVGTACQLLSVQERSVYPDVTHPTVHTSPALVRDAQRTTSPLRREGKASYRTSFALLQQ